MDRSFLSRPEVVQASRKFVCIRLATYESFEEAQVLRSIFVGGSGQVENTTFALLSPDGKTPLARSGRSPNWSFAQAKEMALSMDRIANYYRGRPIGSAPLPAVANLRLAVNVGACDNLPVVALLSDNPNTVRLARVAWEPALLGRAVYTVDRPSAAARLVSGGLKPGLYVLQPGTYGQDARVLASLEAESPDLSAELTRALDLYRYRSKDPGPHIREGNQRGVYWQTQIPVTDPNPRPPR